MMNLNPLTNIDIPLENLDVKLRPMENNPEDTQIVNSNQQVVEEKVVEEKVVEEKAVEEKVVEEKVVEEKVVEEKVVEEMEIFQPLDSESQEGPKGRGSEFCPEGGTEGGPEVVRELPLPHEVIIFGLVVLGLYYVWKWFNKPKDE